MSDNKALTLEQLREMDGEPVWVKQYKTVGIVCLSARSPKDPAVLFWWRQETHMLYVSTCNLEVYPYHPAHIDWKSWEPCKECVSCENCQNNEDFDPYEGSYGECGQCCDNSKFKPKNFCYDCGRPLTPEAWAELEKRVRG